MHARVLLLGSWLALGFPAVGAVSLDLTDVTAASGVNIHFTDPQPGEMEMMQAAGFKWARMDFSWQGTERQKGMYDFSAYDRLLAALEKHGMRAYYIFDYSNSLYEPAGSVRSAEGRAAFAKWTVAAVEHFKDKPVIWEFWNEPNGGFWPPAANAGEYVAMAKEATDAIRKDHPEVYLTGPATSGVDLTFLKACFAAGLHKQWNSVSVHPYRQTGPESVDQDYQEMQKAAGSPLAILSGEWGYSSAWGGYDPAKQGRMLAREWLVNASQRVPVSIWYDWHDDGTDPKEPEHHFGTVENAYHAGRDPVYDPKPAYAAAKIFDTLLAKHRFSKRLSLGETDDQALLFQGEGGDLILALWSGSSRERDVVLPSDDGDFPAMNHLGEKQAAIVASHGNLRVHLDASPRYVIFEHGNGKLASIPEALPVKLSVAPIKNGGIAVTVESWARAPFEGKLFFSDRLDSDKGRVVKIAPGVQSFEFPEPHPSVQLVVQGVEMAEARAPKVAAADATLLANARAQGDGDGAVEGRFAVKEEADGSSPAGGETLAVDYLFGKGWKFLCIYPGKEAEGREIPGGVPEGFGAWIEGDGSGLIPRLRLKDAAGRTWQPTFPAIDWKGWRYVEAKLDPETGHWGGDSTAGAEPVGPLRWEAPFLLDNASRMPSKGIIRFSTPAAIGK